MKQIRANGNGPNVGGTKVTPRRQRSRHALAWVKRGMPFCATAAAPLPAVLLTDTVRAMSAESVDCPGAGNDFASV